MSFVARKPVFRVSKQEQHRRDVKPQKIARGLKFRIEEVEGLYYLCSKIKGTDQLSCPRDSAMQIAAKVGLYF